MFLRLADQGVKINFEAVEKPVRRRLYDDVAITQIVDGDRGSISYPAGSERCTSALRARSNSDATP